MRARGWGKDNFQIIYSKWVDCWDLQKVFWQKNSFEGGKGRKSAVQILHANFLAGPFFHWDFLDGTLFNWNSTATLLKGFKGPIWDLEMQFVLAIFVFWVEHHRTSIRKFLILLINNVENRYCAKFVRRSWNGQVSALWSHGVLLGPLLGTLGVLLDVSLVQPGDLWHKGVVRVGVTEHRADG